jgi:hypothetical protein
VKQRRSKSQKKLYDYFRAGILGVSIDQTESTFTIDQSQEEFTRCFDEAAMLAGV